MFMSEKDIMKLWDSWKKAISKGDASSWPRDAFENLIACYEEEIKRLQGLINEK